MQYERVREPNASENRLISRHAHRSYNNLLVAGLYHFPADFDPSKIDQLGTYLATLRVCLDAHSFLSVVLRKDEEGKQAFFRPPIIDLKQHFKVIKLDEVDEEQLPQRTIEHLCNNPDLSFFDSVATRPPWRIDIARLGSSSRVFISFTYSHYIGDGMSGVAFQRTFAEAVHSSSSDMDPKPIYKTSSVDLPMLPHLPVSLLYLLGPALGHYLPRFIADWLGMKASVSGADENTWAAGKTFIDTTSFENKSVPTVTTAVEILSIDNETITAVLQACRRHGTKLTSVLNEIIAQCLSRHLPHYITLSTDQDNFIASIPTNIRKLSGVPDTTMGIFASAAYSRHTIDRHIGPESEYVIMDAMWTKSRQDTASIHQTTNTLKNQPIALLNWISDIDAWMAGQIDRPRDVTWELSNLLAFDAPKRPESADIEKMYFCQPADATGQPLVFNVISTKGGDMTICAAWQINAFALDTRESVSVEANERMFVREVLGSLAQYLQRAADSN